MKNGAMILTSAGLKTPVIADEVLGRLPKKPQDTKLAHIITAGNVAPDQEYLHLDKVAMDRLGFRITDIDLVDKTEEELYDLLKSFDIIYVQGGNPFYLLKHIRQSGFDRVVRKLLAEGKWYVGVSAGSYVCCPTIEMGTWKREVDDFYGLEDLMAMGLVPFLLTVHYNREKYREKLAQHLPHPTHPVKILTDEQALIIDDGEIELIGTKPEITIEEIVG